MNEFKRLHKISILSEFLRLIRRLVIPIIISYIIGQSTTQISINPELRRIIILACLLLSLLYGLYRWITFRYQVHDQEIQIQKGLFIKNNTYISKDNIKSINISKALIPRMFGLVQLIVKCEGTEDNEPEIKLVALSKHEALRIEHELFHTQLSSKYEIDSSSSKLLNRRALLLTALTSNSLLPTFITISVFYYQFDSQLNKKIGIPVFNSIPSTPIIVIILWSLVLLIVVWALSVIRTMLRFGNFKVFINENKIHIQKGLFEKKELIIDKNDFRAIRIEENVFKQPFGLACIYIESSGGESNKRNVSTVLHPLIKKHKIENFLSSISLPYPSLIKVNSLPKQSRFRYILRKLLIGVVISLILIYISKLFWVISVPVLFLFFFYGNLQYKDAGYGIHDNLFLLKKRFLNKNTLIFIKDHIESISFYQSYFQKKKELHSISLIILSNLSKKKFKLIDTSKSNELTIHKWYKKRK